MACPSDSICLVQLILGTGEEHRRYQLRRGLLPPAHVWRFYLYNPRSCLLGSLILPVGESKVDLSTLLCLFYFLWLCWKKQAEKRTVVMFDVLTTFCRNLKAPAVVCGDPHSPVSYTVMLSANGADGRWLLDHNICPEAEGKFILFLFACTRYQWTASKYFLENGARKRMMFLQYFKVF